jgi:hypothetical protein
MLNCMNGRPLHCFSVFKRRLVVVVEAVHKPLQCRIAFRINALRVFQAVSGARV